MKEPINKKIFKPKVATVWIGRVTEIDGLRINRRKCNNFILSLGWLIWYINEKLCILGPQKKRCELHYISTIIQGLHFSCDILHFCLLSKGIMNAISYFVITGMPLHWYSRLNSGIKDGRYSSFVSSIFIFLYLSAAYTQWGWFSSCFLDV